MFYSSESSFWKSCTTISDNLQSAIRCLYQKPAIVELFDFNQGHCPSSIIELAGKICAFNPERIHFIDHRLHPQTLLEELDRRSFYSAELVFHVFGDFVLFAKDWCDSEDDLKKFKVRWVAASHKQADLVKKFLRGADSSSVTVAPFPVDTRSYHFSPKLRQQGRSFLGLNDSDPMILYTGRISMQKNVASLLKVYPFLEKILGRSPRIFLAGPFDELGIPYLGRDLMPMEYQQDVISTHSELEPKYRKNITFLGNCSEEELNILYNSADCFVSLSAHNDEDFGMAPAEALMTGCPAVLTNWGGYSSMGHYAGPAVTLIETRVELGAISINLPMAIRVIANQLKRPHSEKARKGLVKKIESKLGIEGVAKQLKLGLGGGAKKFSGFNAHMHTLGMQQKLNKPPFLQVEVSFSYNNLYRTLYQDYADPIKNPKNLSR